MKKVLFVVLLSLFWGFSINAEEKFSLEQQVPARTVFYMSFPDIKGACEVFQETAFYKIAQEQEMQQLVNTMVEPYRMQIQQFLQMAEMQLGASVKDTLGIFHGEFSLAVVDIIPQKQYVGVVASINFGPNRKVVDVLLQRLAQMGIQLEATSFAGRQIFMVKAPNVPMPLALAFEGNTMVLAITPNLLVETLKGDQKSLVTSADYKKIKQKIVEGKGSHAFFLYVNIRKLLQQFGPMIPPKEKQIMTLLGVLDFTSMAISSSFSQGHMYDAFFLGVEGKKRGLIKLLHGTPVSLDLAKQVPDKAVSFTAVHFDITKMIDEVEEIIKTVDAREFAKYQKEYQKAEKFLGFSIRNDLAASLGDSIYSFQYMPPKGGLMVYGVGMIEIKDFARFFKWAGRVAELGKVDIKKTRYRDQDIYYLSTPLGTLGEEPFTQKSDEDMMAIIGANFSGFGFMIDGDKMFFGSNIQYLKNFVRNRKGWKKFLVDSPEFQKATKGLSTNSSLVIYQDYRHIINLLWNSLVLPLGRLSEGLLRDAGIAFDSSLIPQANTISQHMLPGSTAYSSNADGLLLEGYSSGGGAIYAVPVMGIVAAVAIPGMLRARISANEGAAQATLRSLATAQAQFAASCAVDQDNDGTGEYGYLQELSGTVGLRGSDQKLSPAYISEVLGQTAAFNNGITQKSGYNFYCYLPGKTEAIGEMNGIQKALKDYDAIDLQENYFAIYAWPIKPDSSGVKTFVVTQSAEVYECDNHNYDHKNLPQPQDAFSNSSFDAKNLQGEISPWETSQNGSSWRPGY